MSEASYEESVGAGRFEFTADGFLTYMVRNLVGTLLEIGSGRMAPSVIDRILESGDRRLAAATAPSRALCLWQIAYSDDQAESG
jgi:tRNA pseudouridine38-40 synthase